MLKKALTMILIPIFTITSTTQKPFSIVGQEGISWEDWVECIAWQESRHNQWAVSRRGAFHGRGRYQISEPCLTHFIWEHPGSEWLTPKALFNNEIGRTIAIWYLYKASRVYDEIKPPARRFDWVLSAYNQGIDGTLSNASPSNLGGINHEYVRGVWNARRFLKQDGP